MWTGTSAASLTGTARVGRLFPSRNTVVASPASKCSLEGAHLNREAVPVDLALATVREGFEAGHPSRLGLTLKRGDRREQIPGRLEVATGWPPRSAATARVRPALRGGAKFAPVAPRHPIAPHPFINPQRCAGPVRQFLVRIGRHSAPVSRPHQKRAARALCGAQTRLRLRNSDCWPDIPSGLNPDFGGPKGRSIQSLSPGSRCHPRPQRVGSANISRRDEVVPVACGGRSAMAGPDPEARLAEPTRARREESSHALPRPLSPDLDPVWRQRIERAKQFRRDSGIAKGAAARLCGARRRPVLAAHGQNRGEHPRTRHTQLATPVSTAPQPPRMARSASSPECRPRSKPRLVKCHRFPPPAPARLLHD